MVDYPKWSERHEEIKRFKWKKKPRRWIHAVIGRNKENGKVVIRLISSGNRFSISEDTLPVVDNLINSAASYLGWVAGTPDTVQNMVQEAEELRKIKTLNTEQTQRLKERIKTLAAAKQSFQEYVERLSPQTWKEDLKEFSTLLNEKNTDEKTIQNWLFEQTWVFGPYYVETQKEEITRDNDRVDFLLKRYDTYYDVIELKLPSVELFDNVKEAIHSPSRENPFSTEVKNAISQVIKYLEEYELDKGAKYYTSSMLIHKPKAIIVVGRRTDKISRALKTLNSRLNGVEIFTYDDMLEIGKNLIDMFEKSTRPKIKK